MDSNKDIKKTSQQMLAALSLAGQVAMHQPSNANLASQIQAMISDGEENESALVSQDEHEEILAKMLDYVHRPVGRLDKNDELYLEQQLTDILGFEVVAELEGNQLNHLVGIMGGEQHLKRYPTDSLDQHDVYREAGIAPNRGAFGWFTEGGQLTDKAIQMEKYYFAVQTLYLPDWNQRHSELKPWYKFRKMIVVNPSEEIAVVGVVGDAGPAQWVKKQFGGSPEVIREGKIWSPRSQGRVMLFFVNDPNDQIELGPISLAWKEKI